jgi:hypothetical protein
LGIGDWAQSPIPNPQSPLPSKFNTAIIEIILSNIAHISDFFNINNIRRKSPLILK